ncbi:hypothetical protein FHP25_06140 [Vineibacter terrae]|uniref:Uncharacterized protein n=1 Tax=Vineibacter terrae TaxID=2586908 RepID=A0A5C8PT21_9HYPH|nr:hypothetical protein [Vineibacter terrae]TXL79521.1 hypothetical protein FHP25_06140 [Vineibacter terrae]
MQFRPFDTLSEAFVRVRSRPPRTIYLILGLEGARYYVFFSQPDLGQLMNRLATQKVGINMEIEELKRLQPDDDHVLLPSQVAQRLAGFNANHNARRARTEGLTPHLLEQAQALGVQQDAGHAEMFMIESWRRCVDDFMMHRHRYPKRGEIFLSHTPCRTSDDQPSPAMLVDGRNYPTSCRAKLYTFFKANPGIRWKIWYELRFGSAEQLNDTELASDFPGIEIARMTPDVLHLI